MPGSLQELLARLPVFGTDRLREIGVGPFLLVLALAVAASIFVAYLYRHFYSGRTTGSEIYRAFPLLGLSVTAIFVCIQFSLPLSLGLLGALSIVRFRTPIKDPEEIGFIMLVIAAALACATFNLLFLVAILGVAFATLVVRRYAPGGLAGASDNGSLIVSLPEAEYREHGSALLALLERQVRRARVDSVTRNGGEMVLALSFKRMPSRGLLAVEDEVRRLVEPTHFTILYDRPGAL